MGRLRFVLPIMLAFIIVLAAGSPVFATKGSYPGVNGKIAYALGGPGGVDIEIFVMNNDGTGSVQLTDNTVYDNFPCWSPDGTKIAFVHGDYPDRQIWVMDANGENQRQLTASFGGNRDPAWSPDGSKIAYTRDPSVYVIDAAGPVGTGTLLISGARQPSWSPDGSEIAYDSGGNIYVADATTGTQKRTLGDGEAPCWSPDGTKIVFERRVENVEAIWVMNAADGSNLQQLSDDVGYAPNWSPDGTKIAFWRSSDSIWVMNADGSNEYDLNSSLSGAVEPDYQRLPSPTPSPVPSNPPGYVGGEVYSANKVSVLVPYLMALLSIVAVAAVVVKRRRT